MDWPRDRRGFPPRPRCRWTRAYPSRHRLRSPGRARASWKLELPLLARYAFRLGPFSPYAGAGLELGYAHLPGIAEIAAAGPILEVGERFYLFKSGFFLEPYAGAALMLSWQGEEGPTALPGAFGGLRIGFGF